MKAKRPTGFLNVDLEVESRSKLDRLAVELRKSLWVLYCGAGESKGTHLLVMESSAFPATPEATIRALVAAVDGLSVSGRRLWDRARRRTFDVGYELPAGTHRVLWS